MELNLVFLLMQDARARYRRLRRSESGATVLEWAMIAAVVVVAASILGAIIIKIVQDKGQDLTDCANHPVGSQCGG